MPQPLSSREGNLFRQVVRNYEEKQYKRGLKAAEQILKKNPKHGDTMAMKALILNAQGKTEEAFALGKEALTVDMKSHICWHVYGLLYRTNKNFEEAIKAYRFALRLEPESSQIQRDLAILQIQMRDYQGYVQSRLAMLQARPQLRQSWTGLAIAHHLAGNLAEAENILKTFEETLKVQPSRSDLEHAEAIMYRNAIIAESGDYQRALDHLETTCKQNLDRLAYLENRASYLTQLGKKEEAVAAYRALLDRNPDHADYYDSLVKISGAEDGAARKAIYDEYATKFPRCDAAKRLPLDFLTGDDFRAAAKIYLTWVLGKGVPSTFANLKHLYADEFKKTTVLELVNEYLATGTKDQANGDFTKGRGAALYFLAQHYNYYRSRDLAKAMEFVDKAIEEDPKNVDFAMTKARIWKHHGNSQKASEAMEYARSLDVKDRYINTKAAKYQLRNNETEKALKTMGLFTKADTPGGPLADLLDMQSVWFLTEDGEANARLGNTGLALKRFHSVYNIFDIWQEDQFDFHSFSLRKGMIRAYIDMVRWEDHLRDHPFYTRVAIDAADVYLRLYEQQNANGANGVNGSAEGNANGDDALEKKKAAKKAKKEAQRLERETAEKASKQDPNKSQKSGKQDADALKKKDEDPMGLKLAATADPLAEAMKFVSPMLQCSPKNLEAQTTAFEVLILRKKYLLALKSLKAALAIDAENPRAHEQAIRLRHALNQDIKTLPPKAAEVMGAEFTEVPASADLAKLNDEFRKKHKASAQHVLSSIRVQEKLGGDRAKLAKEVVDVLQLDGIELQDASDAQKLLKSWDSGDLQAFKKAAAQKWPESSTFA